MNIRNSHIERLKHAFPQWVYGNISACLNYKQGVGATILICSAIDTLSYYASANPSTYGNKQRFTQFVASYFPSNYDPTLFYKFVRCGLVHSFNMENYYIIICSNKKWAQSLHLKKPKGLDKTIINPFVLLNHLKNVHKNFIIAINSNVKTSDKFLKAYSQRPLAKQNKSVKYFEAKYKYL